MKLTIDIPKGSVGALLVAISNHAHSFGVSVQTLKDQTRQLTAEELHDLEVWNRNCHALESVKGQIKSQAQRAKVVI